MTTEAVENVGQGVARRRQVTAECFRLPFVIAVLCYAVDVDGGNGGEPEEIALGDLRVL
jgi:decaprenyl-phosphate phosphoribosyltransferase